MVGAVAGAVAEAVAGAVAATAAAAAAAAAWLIHGLPMATVAVARSLARLPGLAVVGTGEGHHSRCAAMAGEEVVAASVV